MSLRVGGSLVWLGYLAILLVAISEFLAGLVLLRNAIAGSQGKTTPLMAWAMGAVGMLLVVSTIPLGFIVMIIVSRMTKEPSPEIQQLVEEIRTPKGGVIAHK
jgi:Na+(H+)/acetate symporter ActP